MPYAEYHLKEKQRERSIRRRSYFKEYSRRKYRNKLDLPLNYVFSREGTKHTREAIEKMRLAKLGEKNPLWKKHPSKEATKKNREAHIGEKNASWLGGISSNPYATEFNEELKELVRHRDGYKCQKCGCPEIENSRKLSVHHIDYDKQNSLPLNLISLCMGCNVTVNFDRRKWTKYFQKKIKKIMELNTIQFHFRIKNSKRKRGVLTCGGY